MNTYNELGYDDVNDMIEKQNIILLELGYYIEDSYKSYDEFAYENDIDISSKVEVISSEQAGAILNDLGYDDYSTYLEIATLNPASQYDESQSFAIGNNMAGGI